MSGVVPSVMSFFATMRAFLFLTCLTLLTGIASHLQAQQPTATAEATPNPVSPGQPATFTITVENANPSALPNLNLPAPLVANGGVSTSNEISIVNGVQSIMVRFTWPISSPQAGTFTIPPQDIAIGGGSVLKSNEVTLEVKAGSQSARPDGVDPSQDNGLGQMEPILQLRMAKTEFYQGEIVPITATLYLPRTVQLRRLGLIEVDKQDLAIQRFPQQAEQSLETLGNVRYITLTFQSSLSALKPGKMKVGPAKTELILDIPLGNSRNFPFGFMQMDQRKVTVKAPEISLNVLPLPQEGRPKNFSGAVGDFSLSATSQVKEASVGDPVAVDLMIEGQGNFDAIEAPVLATATGWKTYPAKRYNVDSGDPNTADLINRKVGFNQIIVPDRVATEIPAFEFSFFSPRTKQYTHLRSQPIPITIKPSAQAPVAAAGTVGSVTNTAQKPPASPAPEADITDILMPIPAQARWATASVPLLSDKRFLVVNAVLALAFLALIGWSLWSRMLQKAANSVDRQRRQLRQAVEAGGLSEAEFYRRAAHYVLHVCRGRLPEAAQDIMTRYEALNFAGPQAGSQPVDGAQRAQVLALLNKIESSPSVPPSLPKAPALTAILLLACGALQASPQEQYQAAVKALEKSDFKAAKAAAETVVQAGEVGPEIFTVLGHASYKQGQPGIAAMWYQRAKIFPGSAPEIRQNLRHIEEKIHFFTMKQNEWAQRFGLGMSRNGWIFVATIGAWLSVFSIAFLILGARHQLKTWAALTLVLGLLAAGLGCTGYCLRPAAEDIMNLAFVTAPKAQAHTAASQVSGSVIIVPPGSVVRRISERGSWTYVEIPQPEEHLRGWLPTDQIEPWWPYDVAKLP